MKVWKETEIQEMLLNQHFLDFPLNRATIVLFKIMYCSYTSIIGPLIEKRYSTIGRNLVVVLHMLKGKKPLLKVVIHMLKEIIQ